MVRWIDGRQTDRQAGRQAGTQIIDCSGLNTKHPQQGSVLKVVPIVVMSGRGAFERRLGPGDCDFMKVLIYQLI